MNRKALENIERIYCAMQPRGVRVDVDRETMLAIVSSLIEVVDILRPPGVTMVEVELPEVERAAGQRLHAEVHELRFDNEPYTLTALRVIKDLRRQVAKLVGEAQERDESMRSSREAMRNMATCNHVLSIELNARTEELASADADRVPLAMDLAEARAQLERVRPLVDAAQRWAPIALRSSEPASTFHLDMIKAVDAYEMACSAAANADEPF